MKTLTIAENNGIVYSGLTEKIDCNICGKERLTGNSLFIDKWNNETTVCKNCLSEYAKRINTIDKK